MYACLGGPEGTENAVIDSPIYDRVLMRYVRRWASLEPDTFLPAEFDDGNGMVTILVR